MELNFNEFEVLSHYEKSIITDINNTEKKYKNEVTIPDLFTNQAIATPESTAVVDLDSSITYHGLEQESNRIARLLYTAGVKPNQLVAIMTDRGIDQLAAIFGILKAGGAYVPIDPEYPSKRINYMLTDSACQVLVTDSSKLKSVSENLPESVSIIICLDQTNYQSDCLTIYERADINMQSDGAWNCPATEDDLAYVIYTSGSTGEPKGVLITHKAVLNTLFWLQETFQLAEDDVIAQKTSASFTDSVWEFFWPMIYGAKLSIYKTEVVKDPLKLYNQLLRDKITITQFVPAQMNLFLEEIQVMEEKNPLPFLKWVFNGGEALLVNTVKNWYNIFKNAKIANIYGMTESAIYATNYIIEEEPPEGALRIPLGKPIANTQVYILDKHGHLSPVGVKGEICIGGVGISKGYWNKEELTEKAFTYHPETGIKLYCTGDLGLLTTEGIIEYLGRKDDQVQVRGFRVELKEVERAVTSFPKIKEAAVIARIDNNSMTNLYCYFTSLEKGLELSEFKLYLKDYLPDYMIPLYFFELKEMPLTPNGKIDRKNLPLPKKRIKSNSEYVAPRNEKEHILVSIWADILNLKEEDIGIHDSFFESGGNSISIIRLHRRIKNSFDFNITVAELFSYPTIATFVNYQEKQNHANDEMLDEELMSLLEQVEVGTINLDETINALSKLKEE